MRLTELEPQWLRHEWRVAPEMTDLAYLEETESLDDGIVRTPGDRYQVYVFVHSIAEAQGIEFLCPKCFETNHGLIGTHAVVCWSSSRGVHDDADPKPGRWQLVGSAYNDLTLDAEPGKSRSVLLIGGCGWHGFITNGEVTDA